MAKTKIEWADISWNIVTGCDKVSTGCKNCYAARWATTRLKNLSYYKDGFYGNVHLHENRLTDPYKLKTPQTIFPCSMSDLFHPEVPFIFIEMAFNVMTNADWHIYKILTKRPARILEYIWWRRTRALNPWPIEKHIWIGVSVENQRAADDRIPILKYIPAAVRWISMEPLLEYTTILTHLFSGGIHWVVVGGESGPNARPLKSQWVNVIKRECEFHRVPMFFKQGSQTQEWPKFKDFNSFPEHLKIREYPKIQKG